MAENLFNPPKKVKLNLVGVNGNAFVIMGVFQRQARREEWHQYDIELVLNEAMNGDYQHLLATIQAHCETE